MLDIILLILQILGIILLSILIIILTLSTVILFMPIRYQVEGKAESSLDSIVLIGSASWFAKLIRAHFQYGNRKLTWHLRIGWIKLPREAKNKKVKKKKKKNQIEEKKINPPPAKVESAIPLDVENSSQNDTIPDKETKDGENRFSTTEEKISILQKIIAKIRYTKTYLCARIKKIVKAKEKLLSFINDEIHQQAFKRIRDLILELLSKCKPKKAEIVLEYGFEDPYHTGLVLAFLSFIFPLYGNTISVTPNFEEPIINGKIEIKGHLTIFVLIWYVIKVFRDSSIKKTIKDFRNFK